MKLRLLLVVGMMSVMLLGCANTQTDEKDKVSAQKGTESETEIKEDGTESENSGIQLGQKSTFRTSADRYEIEGPWYSMDEKYAYQCIEKGYTNLYQVAESRYIAVTCNRDVTVETLKEAHEKAYEGFLKMFSYEQYAKENVVITKEDYVTIDGREMYFYEGTVKYGYGERYECYAVGYSFIMDGNPVNICGAVLEKEQSKELIQEVNDTIVAMIKTIHVW